MSSADVWKYRDSVLGHKDCLAANSKSTGLETEFNFYLWSIHTWNNVKWPGFELHNLKLATGFWQRRLLMVTICQIWLRTWATIYKKLCKLQLTKTQNAT